MWRLTSLEQEKTTVNEYLSIDSKEHFNEEKVLLHEQRYVIESFIHKLNKYCCKVAIVLFIWSLDTGQRIACFDSCQLTKT